MFALGQKAKNSRRANVVRFTPNSDRRTDIPDRQFGAITGKSQRFMQSPHRQPMLSARALAKTTWQVE
jgi:hypothetical protein